MKPKKQIIFLEPWTTPMIYKMARLFKKNGYYTISIRILSYPFLKDSFFKDGFDEIISFNQEFNKINLKSSGKIIFNAIKHTPDFFRAKKQISKLNPYVIICRTTPNWLCAITKILYKKIPLIYFPYDIRAQGDFRLDGYTLAARRKITKEKLPKLELNSEKYCFENADGILHKGAPEELKYLDERIIGKNFKICPLQLQFPPYCSEDFIVPLNKNKLSKKDGEIHVVTVESSGSSSSAAPASYVVDYAESLAKQNIHFHVYVIPNVSTPQEVKQSFKENYGFLFKSKYFHFHKPLNPKSIIKTMSKYDYGAIILSLDLKNPEKSLTAKFSTGNKISSYLEAGIPFFYYKNFTYTDRILKKYGLNLTYRNMNDIGNLSKTISNINYKNMEKKVLKARKDFLMEKNFLRLEKFVEKVVKSRERKNDEE